MLIGQRVILRPVIEEDWQFSFEWLSDPEVNASLPSGIGMPLTLAEVREQVHQSVQADDTSAYFTILNAEKDSTPIGSAHLTKIDPWSRNAELGLWIGDKSVWGQGFGSEVTEMLLRFAFGRLNLHKIYVTVDADHPGAIRCYEKSGFKREGVLRDEVFNYMLPQFPHF